MDEDEELSLPVDIDLDAWFPGCNMTELTVPASRLKSEVDRLRWNTVDPPQASRSVDPQLGPPAGAPGSTRDCDSTMCVRMRPMEVRTFSIVCP